MKLFSLVSVHLSMQDQIANIYNQYMADIYRYCFARLGNKEQAEDITAETFVALMSSKDVSKIENIKLWLIGVARHKLIDKYRKNESKLISDTDLDVVETVGVGAEQTLEEIQIEADLLSEIKQELQNLDEISREILVLRHWEDLKFNEIAEIFMISESTIKSKYYRGLETLKDKIEQEPKKGKRIRAISIPLLFLALPKIKTDAAFAPASQFKNSLFNLLINNSNMNKVIAWIKAHKLLVVISTCVLVALVIAVAILVQANNSSKENTTNTTTSSLSSQSSSQVSSASVSATSVSSASTSTTVAAKTYEAKLDLKDHSTPRKVIKSGKLVVTSLSDLAIEESDGTALTVKGQNVSIEVSIPSDGADRILENMVEVFTHPQLGKVYRWKPSDITIQGNTTTYPYNYVNVVKECELMDGTKKPCTPNSLDFGYDGLYLNISCSEGSDIAKCDEIVRNLTFTEL